jgi:hypothetical protein
MKPGKPSVNLTVMNWKPGAGKKRAMPQISTAAVPRKSDQFMQARYLGVAASDESHGREGVGVSPPGHAEAHAGS